jgi:hypothetical protein
MTQLPRYCLLSDRPQGPQGRHHDPFAGMSSSRPLAPAAAPGLSVGVPGIPRPCGLIFPVCRTCGVQYGAPRDDCPICADERQYVGWHGQEWTNLAELRAAGHRGQVAHEGRG